MVLTDKFNNMATLERVASFDSGHKERDHHNMIFAFTETALCFCIHDDEFKIVKCFSFCFSNPGCSSWKVGPEVPGYRVVRRQPPVLLQDYWGGGNSSVDQGPGMYPTEHGTTSWGCQATRQAVDKLLRRRSAWVWEDRSVCFGAGTEGMDTSKF